MSDEASLRSILEDLIDLFGSFRADIANAVRDGKHRPANREKP